MIERLVSHLFLFYFLPSNSKEVHPGPAVLGMIRWMHIAYNSIDVLVPCASLFTGKSGWTACSGKEHAELAYNTETFSKIITSDHGPVASQ